MNYLLKKFDTKFETVPFSKIKNEDFVPALQEAIKEAKNKIQIIKQEKATPTFQNSCEALECVDRRINILSNTFFNPNSCNRKHAGNVEE